MGDVKRLCRKERVEEVIERAFEDMRRSDVRGKRLIVAGSGAMKCLDGARRVDSSGARILRARRQGQLVSL
jgi:hypothetical protein